MGEVLLFIPPRRARELGLAPALPRPPRIPRAPLAWSSAAQTLSAIGAALFVLAVLLAAWLPFIALGWLAYRRLH